MFDSPFDYCKVCRDYVLLDQTQRQCAREHKCADTAQCPLHRYFTGIEFDRRRAIKGHLLDLGVSASVEVRRAALALAS